MKQHLIVTIDDQSVLSIYRYSNLFQALRYWGRRERKRYAKSWRGGKKEKGRERSPPALPAPVYYRFIFVFALSQIQWTRLSRSMEQATTYPVPSSNIVLCKDGENWCEICLGGIFDWLLGARCLCPLSHITCILSSLTNSLHVLSESLAQGRSH